ncbi:MAG: hypothetical protein K6T92_07875, partial [Candidatus Rokubacteria bacterium]|nr:hypothetical protein [Candidatus Rokubacteria bacterium]
MARRPRARYVAVAVACLVAVVVMIRLMADNTVFLEPGIKLRARMARNLFTRLSEAELLAIGAIGGHRVQCIG